MSDKRKYENTGKLLINKRQMIVMLEDGKSRCAVARHFGVTVTAVTKSLQRMGAAA